MKKIAVVKLSKETLPRLIEVRNILKEYDFKGQFGVKSGSLSLTIEKVQLEFSINDSSIEIYAEGNDYYLAPVLIDLQECFESAYPECSFSFQSQEDDSSHYWRSLIQRFQEKPIVSLQRYHRRKLGKKRWTAYRIKLNKIEGLYGQKHESKKDKELRIFAYHYDCRDMDQTLDIPFGTVQEVMSAYVEGTVHPDLPGIIYWAIVEIYCNSGYFWGSMIGKAKLEIPTTAFNEISSFRQCYLGEKVRLPSTAGNPPVFSILSTDLNKALNELKSTNFSESVVTQFEQWVAEAKKEGDDLLIYYY